MNQKYKIDMARKRLLKKEVEHLMSRLHINTKFFENHDIDAADPHVASLLKVCLAAMDEIRKVTK